MKKRMNLVFFSICFLAALLGESYCINNLSKDYISLVGIGIVVLITGYLFLDAIRSMWSQGMEKSKFFLEKMYQEETEKWNERYTEMLNLQKATYSAYKKNAIMVKDQFDEVLRVIDTFEKENEKVLLKIAELQKKSMEGQKNALNLEINYNKEYTKQLIKAIREESKTLDQSSQLAAITELLEQNNAFLKESIRKAIDSPNMIQENVSTDWEYLSEVNHSEDSSESPVTIEEEFDPETILKTITSEAVDLDTYHTDNSVPTEYATGEPESSTEESTEDSPSESLVTDSIVPEESFFTEEAAKDEPIIPLYEDPNKALTADEIASLFAAYGK